MVKAVFVTAPRREAGELGEKLVEEKLAACVNTFDLNSVYRWEGSVKRSMETGLLAKTSDEKLEPLVRRVEELHSYELPEILYTDIDGSDPYLQWVKQETGD